MKPHPRIRKTVMWGGAAVTVLLAVVWAINLKWLATWLVPTGHEIAVRNGTIVVNNWPGTAGGRLSDVRFGVQDLSSMKWWPSFGENSGLWWVDIPIWLELACVLPPTLLAWRRDTLARRRARLNLCPKCSYDRAGFAADATCPECGTLPASV